MKRTLLGIMTSCFFATCMIAQNNGSIHVKVTNITSAMGKILLLTDKGQQGMADAKEKEAIIEMGKLPAGTYKFNVIHDANSNWTLDMDEKNIPTESCASVEVEIKEDTRLVTIELKNYKKK